MYWKLFSDKYDLANQPNTFKLGRYEAIQCMVKFKEDFNIYRPTYKLDHLMTRFSTLLKMPFY